MNQHLLIYQKSILRGRMGNLKNLLFDFILNVNMIHITPIDCTVGLFKAVGNLLKRGGKLMTYGAYAVNGVLTPESNVNFDKYLRSTNSAWGVRDVSLLKNLASENEMILEKMIDVPSNNKCLIFVKC